MVFCEGAQVQKPKGREARGHCINFVAPNEKSGDAPSGDNRWMIFMNRC
jgi:hypothetical protein